MNKKNTPIISAGNLKKKMKRFFSILLDKWFVWLPDVHYLRIKFFLEMGYCLHLRTPITFGEKLQWLKLYNRRPELTLFVDKFEVKEYVAQMIGSEFVIPTLGVWDSPKDIEWEILPEQFVLKTTHGGGSMGVIICKKKSTFNKDDAARKLAISLQQDLYKYCREYPYKDVPRRIIAEEYIEPKSNDRDLSDYKWYCFDGEPKYCQVIQDRSEHETIDFFDTEWVHQEFVGLNPIATPAVVEPPRPANLETQIIIARKLSKGIPYSRIDLYDVGDHIYFGEITLYPNSGFGEFRPTRYNNILGDMIKLPVGGRG